ncbi:hypothetical protein BJY01DRAFT_251114 [Aspergillus pseudoustus]|uniref:Uncharacterized protein n=1 Tax=Aspergillus pseudoustus TaxID=1810923 RepID=A0ABR4JE06_9EURO
MPPSRLNANTITFNETSDIDNFNGTGDPSSTFTLPANETCVHVNETGYSCDPAITHNRHDPLTFPGRKGAGGGEPKFVAWLSQLNLTYTDLNLTGNNSGYTYQPASEVYETDPGVNGTSFIAITDDDPFVTPFNMTLLNPNVVALGLYQAG